MVTAAKTYVVEDAEPGVSSGIPAATFPATLTGLLVRKEGGTFFILPDTDTTLRPI